MTAKDELDKVSAEIKKLFDDRAAFEDKNVRAHHAKLADFDLKIRNAQSRKVEIQTRARSEARVIHRPAEPTKPVEVLVVPKIVKPEAIKPAPAKPNKLP